MVKTKIYRDLCSIYEDYRLCQIKGNMPYLSFPDFMEKILHTRMHMELESQRKRDEEYMKRRDELLLALVEITEFLNK